MAKKKYLDTKDGSLEQSILGVWEEAAKKRTEGKMPQAALDALKKSGKDVTKKDKKMNEKVEYVEYKFKNRNDAMKAKKMLDAVQLMGFEINDDNISNGEIAVDAGSKDMTKYHKEVMSKFRPKVMTQEKLSAKQKKLDVDGDGEIEGSDLAKLRKKAKKESAEDYKSWLNAILEVRGLKKKVDEEENDQPKKSKTETGKQPDNVEINPEVDEKYSKKKMK